MPLINNVAIIGFESTLNQDLEKFYNVSNCDYSHVILLFKFYYVI